MWSFLAILFWLFWMAPDTPKQIDRGIVDPYKAEFLSCNGKADGRFYDQGPATYGYLGFRIVADLNFDGREDVILYKSYRNGGTGCGTGECHVRIFLKQVDASYVGKDFGLHPLAVASKMIKKGVGQLIVYGHSSAEEGIWLFIGSLQIPWSLKAPRRFTPINRLGTKRYTTRGLAGNQLSKQNIPGAAAASCSGGTI
jgi:hypothetical protein